MFRCIISKVLALRSSKLALDKTELNGKKLKTKNKKKQETYDKKTKFLGTVAKKEV